jgi:hypothetical protein
MKSLKLLNKKLLLNILFFLFLTLGLRSEEPVDIWNLETKQKNQNEIKNNNLEADTITENNIYKMQSQNEDGAIIIEEDQTIVSKETKIVGLYDPAENGLDINMWANSNGDQILKIFDRISQIDLSQDAIEILNTLLVTNAYYPKFNITKEQFQKLKSKWLIKNSNFKLIEDYLLKNQIVNENPDLTKYLVNHYLARSEVNKSCEIFSKIQTYIEDEYLSKFKIYCLINNEKKDEAQILIDLKKELGFKDKFYESKISYLMGYNDKPETSISDETILDFHLSHRTNPEFKFEPNDKTSKQIWKYLSTSNLLRDLKNLEAPSLEKIAIIEKATHEKNYQEKELFELYKRFQFTINQLLNIKETSKVLPTIEARALIYQGILITSKIEKKLELMNALKNSFKNEGLEDAFDLELIGFLNEIDIDKVPPNYFSFYEKNLKKEKSELTKIKINNKILHQSKLINYFKEGNEYKNVDKDLKDLLKKIKKNKKYFFSKKDVIILEALKSDGVNVPEKYDSLYKIDENEVPSDIQVSIKNEDMGIVMLRIVEFIGQDKLKDIDADTIYFIISALNQLNIDPIRNKILLKVLPLKV